MKNNFILLLLFLSSCNFPEHYFSSIPECNVENQMQMTNGELIAKLKKHKSIDFRYKFKTFQELNGQTYMTTSFRTEKECFDVKILVDRWDKLAGMKRTNGKSYPQELYNLQWELVLLDNEIVVKYIDMHRIID